MVRFKKLFSAYLLAYKNKKNAELAKDPSNNKDKNVHLKFEQKSIEVDSYNKIEEETMREKTESRKQKRRKLAEKKMRYNEKKDVSKTKLKKNSCGKRLDSLNKEFKVVEDIRKQ